MIHFPKKNKVDYDSNWMKPDKSDDLSLYPKI